MAAITGTKGKSTTTAALGAMLREAGGDVRVGGNIGQAVTGHRGGIDRRHRLRAGGVELPARGHGHLPPAGGGLPEPLRRPPRPPRQLRGVRAGQGPHLRQPDRGRLGGGERGRSRGAGAGAAGRPGAVPAVPSRRATGGGAFFDGRRGPARAATASTRTLFHRARRAAARRAPGLRPPGRGHRGPPDGRARRRRSGARCAAFTRRGARAGARGRDRRRRLLQRLQGHQRGRRAQEPGGLRRPRAPHPRRPLQGRRLRRPRAPRCARTARPCWPSARPRRASRRRWPRWCPWSPARSLREAVERGLPPRRARRHGAAGPRLLVLRHVRDYADARPRLQGRGAARWPRAARGADG